MTTKVTKDTSLVLIKPDGVQRIKGSGAFY